MNKAHRNHLEFVVVVVTPYYTVRSSFAFLIHLIDYGFRVCVGLLFLNLCPETRRNVRMFDACDNARAKNIFLIK